MPEVALRVLFVVHRSARNRLLNVLVDGLPQVQFTIVTLDEEGELDRDMDARGVATRHIPGGSLRRSLAVARQLQQIVQAVDPQLVQSNGYVPSLVVELMRVLHRRSPRSLLARHHNLEHHLRAGPMHVRADGWAARHASAVLAVSPAVRETLIGEHVPAARITVVPNGVDWSAVTVDAAARSAWREQLGGEVLLVAVGRLDPLKDHPTLFRALQRLRLGGTDYRLAVAGTGTDGARGKLEAEAARLGVRDAVTFVGWVSDSFSLVAAADVLVQASIDESFGQAVLEAAGLGVPLAVTTVGGVADLVPPSHPTIGAGQADLLAERVADMVERPRVAASEAATFATQVRRRFTMDAMASGHLALYEELMGTARASR